MLGGLQGTAATRLVRGGEPRAGIEARFTPSDGVIDWLQQQQLAWDADDDDGSDALVVSREWRRQDERLSCRFRINGVAVNRQQVLGLRPLLIDLTVQGQTQQLARPGQQRRWLDRLGAAPLATALAEVRVTWLQWREASALLDQARQQADQWQEQLEERQALLAELEAAALNDGDELKQLSAEQDRLVHGVRLQEGLAQLLSLIHI